MSGPPIGWWRYAACILVGVGLSGGSLFRGACLSAGLYVFVDEGVR